MVRQYILLDRPLHYPLIHKKQTRFSAYLAGQLSEIRKWPKPIHWPHVRWEVNTADLMSEEPSQARILNTGSTSHNSQSWMKRIDQSIRR